LFLCIVIHLKCGMKRVRHILYQYSQNFHKCIKQYFEYSAEQYKHLYYELANCLNLHMHFDTVNYVSFGSFKPGLMYVKAVLSSFKMWFGDGGKSL
jgi:hypothetical protein